jgi:hypothetical protein
VWLRCNPNPEHKEVPDCVVRAICIALHMRWIDVYDDLCRLGRKEFNMPSADDVWGKYLYQKGFVPFLLPESCPKCVTVEAFSRIFYRGTYIIGTGSHAVAVIDGDYYDSWDSGNMTPTYFWVIK